MNKAITTLSYALAVSATLTFAGMAGAETSSGNNHSHSHSHDKQGSVYDGYFDDDQVKARELSDWEDDWQSIYPFLVDGTLDPVMADKARHGDKSAGEYRAYYDTGYKTDVDRIVINGKKVTFSVARTPSAETTRRMAAKSSPIRRVIEGFVSSSGKAPAMTPHRSSFSSATTSSPLRRRITTISIGATTVPHY